MLNCSVALEPAHTILDSGSTVKSEGACGRIVLVIVSLKMVSQLAGRFSPVAPVILRALTDSTASRFAPVVLLIGPEVSVIASPVPTTEAPDTTPSASMV